MSPRQSPPRPAHIPDVPDRTPSGHAVVTQDTLRHLDQLRSAMGPAGVEVRLISLLDLDLTPFVVTVDHHDRSSSHFSLHPPAAPEVDPEASMNGWAAFLTSMSADPVVRGIQVSSLRHRPHSYSADDDRDR